MEHSFLIQESKNDRTFRIKYIYKTPKDSQQRETYFYGYKNYQSAECDAKRYEVQHSSNINTKKRPFVQDVNGHHEEAASPLLR